LTPGALFLIVGRSEGDVMHSADANPPESQVVAHLQMHLGARTSGARLKGVHSPLDTLLLRWQGVPARLAEAQCLHKQPGGGIATRDDHAHAMQPTNLHLRRYTAALPGFSAGNVLLLALGRGNQLKMLAL